MTPLYAFLNLGGTEMVVLLIIGVLLFGRKLPEVGRYLGKGIVEFKRGIKGLEDDIDTTAHQPPPVTQIEQPRPPQRMAATAPKFEDSPMNVTNGPKA